MINRTWEVYSLSDPRTACVRYVGVTFRGKRRINEHLSRASKGGRTHRDCWIRSLIMLGLRPVYSVIERGSGDDWRDRERFWIASHRQTGNLVNHTDGGDGTPGYVPTAALRAKWSAMRKGVKYAPGRVPGMLGKHHAPEVRKRIRAAGTNRPQTDVARAKISAARKGKPLSAGHRQKLSEMKRGGRLTATHREKIAAATTSRKPVSCLETGRIFPSVTAAARELCVTEASVYQAIRKGCRCKGNHLRFV